ncbi:protein shisa-5 [Zootoca vivipara]|uniref:protein shisa-5 n=1 Tax=Zootoca vivipara TaxID=8524 RepID=UPI0015913B1B|nr:protein shisa-5 [Zootoca vivipara]
MACARSPFLTSYALLALFLLLPGGFCEDCIAYTTFYGILKPAVSCPAFCCGSCNNRYCCSDIVQRLNKYEQLECDPARSDPALMLNSAMYKSDDFHFDSQPSGTIIAVGVSIFVLFVVTIILCFTCSCCCLYKACRRQPRPVVTTTTATTVVQVPYPQQPGMPPQGYPVGMYQGYNPLPVQPHQGMPAAPYPTQYPPPYPTQPAGPPPYHETMAAGAAAVQPPYNPAYMDPPKH